MKHVTVWLRWTMKNDATMVPVTIKHGDPICELSIQHRDLVGYWYTYIYIQFGKNMVKYHPCKLEMDPDISYHMTGLRTSIPLLLVWTDGYHGAGVWLIAIWMSENWGFDNLELASQHEKKCIKTTGWWGTTQPGDITSMRVCGFVKGCTLLYGHSMETMANFE